MSAFIWSQQVYCYESVSLSDVTHYMQPARDNYAFKREGKARGISSGDSLPNTGRQVQYAKVVKWKTMHTVMSMRRAEDWTQETLQLQM